MTDAGKIRNNSNRVCQILKTEKPVIQGPMFWLTYAKLVAAVSEAGGLGVLGPHAVKILYQKMMQKEPKECEQK